MARIRTVKPDFFRHEKLQDLEVAHPGKYIMLTFEGLWTLCDSKGKFLFKPRTIKLDVLPFIPFNMEETLGVLEKEGFIETYEVEGEKYGRIPSFLDHQRITGKEATEGEKYPDPIVKQKGSNRETPEKHPGAQEGKGKEGNGIASEDAGNKRDLLWEAMLKGCGLSLTAKPTESERGAWNKALKDLRKAGATEQDIVRRCQAYRKLWPSVSLTPTALARRWNECVSDRGDHKTMPADRCF